MKGEEAKAGFELAQTQGRASEQDLLDRIIHLEKDLRRRDATIQDLKQKGASSIDTETKILRDQIDVLKVCLWLKEKRVPLLHYILS